MTSESVTEVTVALEGPRLAAAKKGPKRPVRLTPTAIEMYLHRRAIQDSGETDGMSMYWEDLFKALDKTRLTRAYVAKRLLIIDEKKGLDRFDREENPYGGESASELTSSSTYGSEPKVEEEFARDPDGKAANALSVYLMSILGVYQVAVCAGGRLHQAAPDRRRRPALSRFGRCSVSQHCNMPHGGAFS